MTSFLLDTNVVSESMRPRPDAKVAAFLAKIQTCAISVITLHELIYGAQRLPDGARRDSITESIENLTRLYADSILAVREAEAARAGSIRAIAARRGLTMHLADTLIAATAAVNGCTLVTRNARDFQGLNLEIVNPFSN